MHRLLTAAVAGGSLLLGFAAAQASGVRWLGAVVVLGGALWCVLRERTTTAWWRLAAILLIGAGCFVLAHLLADVLGPWPSVVLASAGLGAATWGLLGARTPDPDRPRAPVR